MTQETIFLEYNIRECEVQLIRLSSEGIQLELEAV